jgi:hypothetical protein
MRRGILVLAGLMWWGLGCDDADGERIPLADGPDGSGTAGGSGAGGGGGSGADAGLVGLDAAVGPGARLDAALPPANDAAPSVTIDANIPQPAPDAAPPAPDMMLPPPGPDPGFGDITGGCAGLDAMDLAAPTPAYFANALDFGADPYDEADEGQLTAGGRQILADGTAGGSSSLSEVFSFEVLARCEGAVLLASERFIEYRPDHMGSITDILVEIDGRRVGVSVTRAVGFPRDDPYTVERASELLADKLEGVLESSAGVAEVHAWDKQILHMIAWAPMHADSIRTAWDGLGAELRADTILWVTVTDGADEFLY